MKEIRSIYFSVKAETTPFSIFWLGPEILLIVYLVTSVTKLLKLLKNEEVYFYISDKNFKEPSWKWEKTASEGTFCGGKSIL